MSGYRYGGHVGGSRPPRLHYLRYGRGLRDGAAPPLILVPGITSPAITWGFVAERLAASNDVIVMDVRGRGLSETAPDGDYGLDACADDVVRLADGLQLEQFALLGHSMGARIGLRLAERRREHLSSLILVDPPLSGPGRTPYAPPLDWYVDSIRLAQRGTTAEALRAYLPGWSDEQLQLRAEWLHTCDEAAITASYRNLQTEEVFASFAQVPERTLLMTAGAAGVITAADTDEVRRMNPSVTIRTVEGAGHMIPWDRLDAFYEALHGFVPSLQPQQSADQKTDGAPG